MAAPMFAYPFTRAEAERALRDVPMNSLCSRCGAVGHRLAATLRGPCSEEARALLRDGFKVSAPATLEMIAARIYPTMPIEHPVDRLYPDAPFVRLLAVGTAIEQLPNVVDLSWSMAWSAAMLDREVNTVLALAAVALWLTRQGADGERWIRDAIASDIRASL